MLHARRSNVCRGEEIDVSDSGQSRNSASGSAHAHASRGDAVRCSVDASPAMLDRNLAAMSAFSTRAAAAIGEAVSGEGARFDVAPDGGLTATWNDAGTPRRLASARAPVDEAHRWCEGVTIADEAVLVLSGFGLGHHVRALARRVKGRCVVIVYEPDIALLRAVLERHDLTDVLSSGVVRVVCHDEPGTLSAALERCEGLVATGTRIIDHPASMVRLGARSGAFAATLAQVVMAIRTQVVTTLVQVETTIRNLLQNLSWYATCPGIADLKDAAKQWGGAPAIVISAGPSLDRAMDALSDPATRERSVLIATQTVLGTLLARGIKPHFVVALDYHEISRRFYEGLTEEAVRGVTLVVEPKANPAILEAFPGSIRCVGDNVLDELLGPPLAREMGEIPPGATVAHLAYGLARFIGCDPVILAGQDLAFTDGQYYAHHAAIHRVWSNELNAFNTLEMLEWQRIVRMRSMLRRARAVGGGEVYTDEQLHTYRVQFEREFQRDASRGLTTIDASEGGAAKAHTTVLALGDALHQYAKGRVPGDLGDGATPSASARRAMLERVEARLRQVRTEAESVARHCGATSDILTRMKSNQHDQRQIERLIEQAQRETRAMNSQRSGLALAQYLNQTGQLKRFKADRAIASEAELSPMDRQRRQIDRDVMNATWLRDAASRTSELLDQALRTLHDGPKVTRDLEEPDEVRVTRERVAATAVVTMSGDASTELAPGLSAMGATMARLSRCASVKSIVVLAQDAKVAEAALSRARSEAAAMGVAPLATRIAPIKDSVAAADRLGRISIARSVGPRCWRGGIANTTAWDEVFLARETLAALEADSATARSPAVILGWNWSLIDPALTDALVERHAENPDSHPLAFATVPPGVAPVLLSHAVIEELARASGPMGSIGGLLGYIPGAPRVDPIAKGVCVGVHASLRDCGVRAIADAGCGVELVRSVARALGSRWLDAGWIGTGKTGGLGAPGEMVEPARAVPLTVEHAEIVLDDGEDASSDEAAEESLARAAERGGLWTVTIRSAGTLDGDAWSGLVARARALSPRAIHVRTYLDGGEAEAQAILVAKPDIVSIDAVAATRETYLEVRGVDRFDASRAGIDALITASREGWDCSGGLPSPWIVPRITRCEASRGEIEGVFDAGLAACGWCVIDAPRVGVAGRIGAIPVPAAAAARLNATSVRVVVGAARGCA